MFVEQQLQLSGSTAWVSNLHKVAYFAAAE